MKIVLIRPPDPRGEVAVLSHFPPTNLGYLASYLIKNGYEAEIWDYEIEQFSRDSFIRKIESSKPQMMGFSCFTSTIISGHRLAQIVKENFPLIVTMVGGPHSSALPKRTLEEFPSFDLVVVGEGEETLLEVCCSFEKKQVWKGILGLAYRDDSGIREEPRRPLIENLDKLPFPQRDLLNLDIRRGGKLSEVISGGLKSAEIFSSRGCPIGCFFCPIRVTMGLRIRFRSPEMVLAEVEECMKRYNIGHFIIADDSFTLNQERAAKVCEGFQKLGVRSWQCDGSRVDGVTPQLLKLMAESGCKKVAFGVESGSPRILELIGKKITLEQVRNAFRWSKQAGIRYVDANYIIGSHPSETKEDVQKTIDLIKATRPDLISVSVIVPYPGTPIYNFMKEKGYIFSENWEDFTSFGQLPLWRTEFFSPEDLVNLQRKAFTSFYLRPGYILQTLAKIRNLREIKYFAGPAFDFSRWLLKKNLTRPTKQA